MAEEEHLPGWLKSSVGSVPQELWYLYAVTCVISPSSAYKGSANVTEHGLTRGCLPEESGPDARYMSETGVYLREDDF